MQSTNGLLFQNKIAQHNDDTKRHGQGVIGQKAGLHETKHAAEGHNRLGYSVNRAINYNDVKTFPEELAESLAGVNNNVIVELVNIPFIVDSTVQRGKRRDKASRDTGIS